MAWLLFKIHICNGQVSFSHDLSSIPEDESVFCSSFVHHILKEAGIPVTNDQKGNEYTPKDIEQLEPYCNATPQIYKYEKGLYRLQKKK